MSGKVGGWILEFCTIILAVLTILDPCQPSCERRHSRGGEGGAQCELHASGTFAKLQYVMLGMWSELLHR